MSVEKNPEAGLINPERRFPESSAEPFEHHHVMNAWACVRNNNSTVPDDVLDRMREVLLNYGRQPASSPLADEPVAEVWVCHVNGDHEVEWLGEAPPAGTKLYTKRLG